MTLALALFYIAAAVALGAAVQLLRSRDPAVAIRWFAVAVAAVAAVELLLLAPFVAIAAVFAGASLVAIFTFVSGLVGRGDAPPPKRGRRLSLGLSLGLAMIGVLAWVFLGTWGRQLAFPGHDLAPGASFGGLRHLSAGIASDQLSLSIALPLLLFAGALGAVGLVSRAESESNDNLPSGPAR